MTEKLNYTGFDYPDGFLVCGLNCGSTGKIFSRFPISNFVQNSSCIFKPYYLQIFEKTVHYSSILCRTDVGVHDVKV